MRVPIVLLATAVIVATALPVLPMDPPDSEVNPATGSIDAVDATWKNSAWSIRYSVDAGPGQPNTIETVCDSPEADLNPRLAIDDNGDAGVVWSRDAAVDQVLFRSRDQATKTWSEILQVSGAGESSRNPEIVEAGSIFWVVFEFDDASGDTGIGVNGITDSAEPIPARTLVDTTDYVGEIDVLAHSHVPSGSVWVTWIHSDVDVGWSVYDDVSDSWSLPTYQPYDTSSVVHARGQIMNQIVSP